MIKLNSLLFTAVACLLVALPSFATSTFVDRIVELTNEQRRLHGLASLAPVTSLDNAAQAHADDQAARNYIAHVTPEGVTVTERVRKAGYTGIGGWENLYGGGGSKYGTAEAAVKGWMESPGHRENILNSQITEIGVGLATDASGRNIYVQNFGASR